MEGHFSATLPSFGYLNYSAGGRDYYTSWGQYSFKPGAANGKPSEWIGKRWEPWNPTVKLKVVKRGTGHAMIAKRLSTVSFPVTKSDDGFGYDLEIGDFTHPYGRGKVVDLLFQTTGAMIMKNYSIALTLPGLGNGIIPITTRESTFSEFEGPKMAPESDYHGFLRFNEDVQPIDRDKDERLTCIVFRCRSVVDEKGNVVSARYGKIYPERYNLVYYLNPQENERSLEFDVRQNLMTLPVVLGRVTRP
jgi:hypothetical protein